MHQPKTPAISGEEKQSKSERLEARLTFEQKELLQWAADLEGRSLTDFVVSHAQSAALRTIENRTIIKLDREDSIAFVESLLNPPDLEDDDPLARAIARYQESQEIS
ncbi:DUF1778 domain-containing protein [Merismopedia glauca]|uniref:DUF1778 domain-containing protein n=1 Tax=Merismopedia glauca CCAP 1448/3 TaxID=1296344 RepID=A0A2T1CAH5_9CYAN|nr:DUF1778 domain-containing protein [Merismopedia glauca]PSB05275.1 DUF1778 domain-containing protein [Merismopedia glauca CCAP 1448/3]